jgi:rhamnose utilization protein RhaD (predicted bifunctional aldolase and dehydrogenase)
VYGHWDENNLAQGKYFPAKESYERKIIILHQASSTIKQSENQEFQQHQNPLPHQAQGTPMVPSPRRASNKGTPNWQSLPTQIPWG